MRTAITKTMQAFRMNVDNVDEQESIAINASSTLRVRRHRQRQREAGRKRISLYLDHDDQLKLRQLAEDKGQAHLLEKLMKAAIDHEWRTFVKQQKSTKQVVKKPVAEGHHRQEAGTVQLLFSGRRRGQANG